MHPNPCPRRRADHPTVAAVVSEPARHRTVNENWTAPTPIHTVTHAAHPSTQDGHTLRPGEPPTKRQRVPPQAHAVVESFLPAVPGEGIRDNPYAAGRTTDHTQLAHVTDVTAWLAARSEGFQDRVPRGGPSRSSIAEVVPTAPQERHGERVDRMDHAVKRADVTAPAEVVQLGRDANVAGSMRTAVPTTLPFRTLG